MRMRFVLRSAFGCIATVFVAGGGAAIAAGHAPLHVGDRVLASPSSLRDAKYWRPCTVTEVHDFVPKKAYGLACDAQPSAAAGSFLVNEDWVKPADNAGVAAAPPPAPKQAVNPAPPPAASAAPGPAGSVSCPPSDADTAGATAMEQAFRRAIRAGFEHDAAPGADGRVTVQIQSVAIGEPHAYRVRVDPSEAQGKTIYPVRTRFTTCTDYNRRIVKVQRERLFSCYEATTGAQACDVVAAANTNVRDTSTSIDKPAR